MKLIQMKYLFLLIVFSLSIMSSAQGTLEGSIVDKKTREPLVGATVIINGSTKGSVGDIDGNFVIENVPAGEITVNVQYVSYARLTMEKVKIENNKTTHLLVEMTESEIQLQGVQVIGVRRTNTNLSMLDNTKKSFLVVNGISSQQISRSVDRDAGEVMKRVPGVTIQDSRFVVVRGLNQRYNNVWFNGVTAPSNEADSRAFSFDAVPGGLIDNIMVYKTPAPEIPADFSGGFVKIATKSIPDENSVNVNIGSAFHQGSSLNTFYATQNSVADWVGMGYASNVLPNGFPGKLSSSMSVSDQQSYVKSINKGWSPVAMTSMPDMRFSITLNRRFDLNKVKVGHVTAMNYSNTFSINDIINKRFGIYQQEADEPFARNDYQDKRYTWQSKFSILHNWSFILSPKDRIEFRNFFNHTGMNRFTQRQGEDNNNDYIIKESEMMKSGRSIYTGQLSGKHTLNEKNTNLDWVLGYSYANKNEPDRKIITSRLNEDESSAGFGKYRTEANDIKRYYQHLGEHLITLGSNYENPFTIGSLNMTFKSGILGEYKNRSFTARNFIYSFNNSLLPSGFIYKTAEEMFTVENLNTGGITLKENTNKSDSYTADNQLYATYASLNIPLGPVKVYTGLRAEYNLMRLNGYESDGIKKVNLNRSKLDLFPSVNLTYQMNEKNLVRLAYGNSINRPEFREVAPYVYYDFEQFANFEGYTALKDAKIHNVDLRYEIYPSPSETFSIAFFYKHFTNPIEITYFEVGGQQQFTYRNAESASNMGLEIDVRKNLSMIGLEHFSLIMNGALIRSRVKFPEGAFERDRAMQGQSPYLINAGLYYDSENGNLKMSLLYNRIGKRIAFVGVVNQNISEDIPDIYEMPCNSVDISLTKSFGKKCDLSLEVKDLLDSKIEYKQFPQFTSNGVTVKREQISRSYKPGTNIGFTLRFNL